MTYRNTLLTRYETRRAAGRMITCDTEAAVIAGMLWMAISRDRCYVCDPEGADLIEREVEEQYGPCCSHADHSVYSAGFMVGAIETVFAAAERLGLWKKGGK